MLSRGVGLSGHTSSLLTVLEGELVGPYPFSSRSVACMPDVEVSVTLSPLEFDQNRVWLSQ